MQKSRKIRYYKPPPPVSATPLNTRKKIIVAALMAANAAMMLFVLRQGFVLYGDGPAGMLLFFFKLLLVSTAFSAFLPNIIFAVLAIHAKQYECGFWAILTFLTAFLFLIALIFLYEACENEIGYCRQWHLFFG